ncbi:MAG: hypothetical protein SGBAC_011848 [Bacillariaceae sp.]
MVSISNSSRNKKDPLSGPTLPFLYFCLGAIFMSLFGRLSTMMNVSSGKAYSNELDPNAVLGAAKMNMPGFGSSHNNKHQQVGIVPGNEAEGGLPDTNPQQQYQHLTDELHKKQHAYVELEEKFKEAQSQLQEQQEKITKYESVVDELYKSRRRYGQSEEQKESLNSTLLQVEDKIDRVRSILRGSASKDA